MNRPERGTLLLIDAGNSRTKFGVFPAGRDDSTPLPQGDYYAVVRDDEPAPWEDLRGRLSATFPVTTYITGSNPARMESLLRDFPAVWPTPFPCPDRSTFPLVLDVDFPEKVGIDRLLQAVAANRVRKAGQPAIVVSSGTATTVDYVSADGRFRGGAILPGFEMGAKALHQYTARLPLVALEPVIASPPADVGRNTETAIQSGLYWGHVGGVKELLRRMLHRAAEDWQTHRREEGRHLGNLAPDETPLVILTGGAAPLLAPHLPSFCRSEPHLSLQGLAVIVG